MVFNKARSSRFQVPVIGLALFALSCGASQPSPAPAPAPPRLVQAPPANPPPPPTPAPNCVHGALVTGQQVCGLGVSGPAFVWNDPGMRDLSRRRAARNLAGMLRAVVTSALVVEQDPTGYWSQAQRYVEIDEELVNRIQNEAQIDLWYDVEGTGPFRARKRTYACACLSTAEAGIRIDAQQAKTHALARQYPVQEVPLWVHDPNLHNRSLRCALGFSKSTFHPEEMLEPLTESVRTQLMGKTRTWILSHLYEFSRCRDGDCTQYIESIVEAANEGISRGVLVTAIWLDSMGMGPEKVRNSAYGWGCVFDEAVLERAKRRIEEVRTLPMSKEQGG